MKCESVKALKKKSYIVHGATLKKILWLKTPQKYAQKWIPKGVP